MKSPINSRKHYVQFTQFTMVSASVTQHSIVKGEAVQDVAGFADVTEGSVIKAVFLEYWLLGNGSAPSSFVLTVEKVTGTGTAPTFTNMTTLDSYDNKKNILFTTQGLLGEQTTNPTPLLRQWIKIPKGKQRFGLNDRLKVHIANLGTDDTLGCAFATYKSYN